MGEKLYSRTKYHDPMDTRESINPVEAEAAPSEWDSPKIDDLLARESNTQDHHPIIKKMFYISLIFSVCAALAASLIYFNGDNFISTKNLDIEIDGPINIGAGEIADLEISIINKNNASLDKLTLSIDYPDGTRSATDANDGQTNVVEKLEELGPGKRITKNEKAIFLGVEGQVREVKVSVEYGVKGSNATFTKEKSFEITIGSSPVTVSVSKPQTVDSGDEFLTTITITSNSKEKLDNVILRGEFPYGWRFVNASPQPTNKEKTLWSIGSLAPKDKKIVTLRGVLSGEDGEERTFRYFFGVGEGQATKIDTNLYSDSVGVTIEKPTIDLNVKLNGETSEEYIAPAGKNILTTINFKNNLTETLENPVVEVRLSGGALDKNNITVQNGGTYNATNNSIVWNRSNSGDIEDLNPGDSGNLTFEFASLEVLPLGSQNQRIDLTIILTGRPEGSALDSKVTLTRSVKIASEIVLSAKSLYARGPIENKGPIPPKAETETTYTITLNLSNTRNDVDNVKVSGQLGPNVEWAEEVAPANDSGLSYNATTRTVSWEIGKLLSGSGFSSPGKEVSFKVSLMPSLGQVGGVPVLVSNITLTGFDSFTASDVRISHPSVTTRISSDPTYVQGDEIVVK